MMLDCSSTVWQEALRRLRHDVYHLPGYALVDSRLSGGVPRAFYWHEDDQEFLLPLIFRRIGERADVDVASPYGYPSPIVSSTMRADGWRRACAALVDTLRDEGAVSCFVRLHPLLTADLEALRSVGVVQCHGDTVNIDLRQSASSYHAQLRVNHRRDISRAAARGYTVAVDGSWSRLVEFRSIYAETMQRVDAEPFYFFRSDYFTALRDALADHAFLVVAELDGVVASGGIFTEADGTVQYHLGAHA